MKKQSIYCLLTCLLFAFGSYAQDAKEAMTEATNEVKILATVSESEKSMSQGINSAIVLDIPDAESKFVEKLWKKYLGDYDCKTKKVKKSKDWVAENARIAGIKGRSPISIYSRTESSGSGCQQIVWFDLGEGYLSSSTTPNDYSEAESIMNQFALFIKKEQIQLELEKEEKILKNLDGDLKKLFSQNESYQKKIEQAKETIAKMEANIEQNVLDQEATQLDIEAQKKAVESVKKRLSSL